VANRESVKQRLIELAAGGRLTPNAVVEDARDKDSPLHSVFEWDDAVAADRFRIEQARNLIQSFKVHVEYRETIVSVPQWVRDPEGEQGYRETAEIRDDRAIALAALVSEASRAGAYLHRVRSLAVALNLQAEVDEIIQRFAGFRELIAAKEAA
jgi:hypothetical protein